jgi:hypothetical protein
VNQLADCFGKEKAMQNQKKSMVPLVSLVIQSILYIATPYILGGYIFATLMPEEHFIVTVSLGVIAGWLFHRLMARVVTSGILFPENSSMVTAFIWSLKNEPAKWFIRNGKLMFRKSSRAEYYGCGDLKTDEELIELNPYQFDFFNSVRLVSAIREWAEGQGKTWR